MTTHLADLLKDSAYRLDQFEPAHIAALEAAVTVKTSGKTATPTLCVLRQTVLLLTSCLRLRRLCPTVDCCRKPIHRALS